jgi:hypothetical protein
MKTPQSFQAQLAANREATDAAVKSAFLKQNASKAADANTAPRVSIKSLAARLQMDVSACRKYVLRLGYKPLKIRTPDSNFQLALTVTASEAFDIQTSRAKDGYCKAP